MMTLHFSCILLDIFSFKQYNKNENITYHIYLMKIQQKLTHYWTVNASMNDSNAQSIISIVIEFSMVIVDIYVCWDRYNQKKN